VEHACATANEEIGLLLGAAAGGHAHNEPFEGREHAFNASPRIFPPRDSGITTTRHAPDATRVSSSRPAPPWTSDRNG
jgi:hypothetical protein